MFEGLTVGEVGAVALVAGFFGLATYLIFRGQFNRPSLESSQQASLADFANRRSMRFAPEPPSVIWQHVLQLSIMRTRILGGGFRTYSRAYLGGLWNNKQFFAVGTVDEHYGTTYFVRRHTDGHVVAMKLTREDLSFPKLTIHTKRAGFVANRPNSNSDTFESRFSIVCNDHTFVNHFFSEEMKRYFMQGYAPSIEISGQHIVVGMRGYLSPAVLERHLVHLSNIVDLYQDPRRYREKTNQGTNYRQL